MSAEKKPTAELLLERYDDARIAYDDNNVYQAVPAHRAVLSRARQALIDRMNEHDPVAVAAMNLAEKIDEFFPGDTAHSDFLKELREYRIARGPKP